MEQRLSQQQIEEQKTNNLKIKFADAVIGNMALSENNTQMKQQIEGLKQAIESLKSENEELQIQLKEK